MNGLNYLLQTNLYLMLFMGFYALVLRNETFFRQNRFFLNTSIFLSFLIPFINSAWFRDLFITQKVREAAIMPSQMIYDTIIVGIDEEASALTVADAIFLIYAVGAAVLLIRFFIRLTLLKSSLKAQKGTAFSFFKTLVVDRDMPKADTIIDHEKVHMRQWHSADIIFIELAAIVNWFNPVMCLYKKEIRHIHEFIADEEAATLMQSKSDYALLLFSNTLGVDPLHLSNNFFNKSLLKRRILMLHKNRSRSTGLWKYGFSAPLFMLMLVVSAATASSESNVLSVDGERSINTPENLGTLPLPEIANNKSSPANSLVTVEGHVAKPGTYSSPAGSTAKGGTKALQSQNPQFPGGNKALAEYITKNLKYPDLARKNKITGRVILSFVVDTDGSIEDIKVLRGIGSGADEEAVRVMARSPKWKPGTKNGVPAKAAYTMPIWFAPEGQKPPQNPTVNPNANASKPPLVKTDVKDFSEVEVLPDPPGGMAGWAKYLTANLEYPEQARKDKVTGRVILSFIVEKDGALNDIQVLRGIGAGLDEEALRVLKNSPNWKPGIQNGRPVRVAYTMPIFFQISSK